MSEALLAAHLSGRVRVAIGRASDFFGPGVIASHLGERAFAPLLAGKTVQMIGDPDAPHSYAYVSDVARALATLGAHDEADGRVWHLPSVETRSSRAMLQLAGRIAGVEAKVTAIAPVLLAVLARVNPMVREVRAVGYQLDRPFVVDSSAFERAFDIEATPIEQALAATVDWYRTRARQRRKGPGTAVGRALGIFVLDNILIGLAVLAIRSLVASVPILSVVEVGLAVAAGLYWLPLARRASMALVGRMRTRRAQSAPPRRAEYSAFEGPAWPRSL